LRVRIRARASATTLRWPRMGGPMATARIPISARAWTGPGAGRTLPLPPPLGQLAAVRQHKDRSGIEKRRYNGSAEGRGQPTVGGEIPGGDLELKKKGRLHEVARLTLPLRRVEDPSRAMGDRGRRLAPKDGPGHNVLVAVPQPRPARRQQQRQERRNESRQTTHPI